MNRDFEDDPTPPIPAKQSSGGYAERGFFERNRVWIILVICGLGVLSCSGCLLGIFGMFSQFGKLEVYQVAFEKASNHPDVIAALGTPIEESLLKSASINSSSGKQTADYTSAPLSGPNGKGVLRFAAEKVGDGPWIYSTMQVQLESGQIIDLLEP